MFSQRCSSGERQLATAHTTVMTCTFVNMHSAVSQRNKHVHTSDDIMKAIGLDTHRCAEVCVLLNVTQRTPGQAPLDLVLCEEHKNHVPSNAFGCVTQWRAFGDPNAKDFSDWANGGTSIRKTALLAFAPSVSGRNQFIIVENGALWSSFQKNSKTFAKTAPDADICTQRTTHELQRLSYHGKR